MDYKNCTNGMRRVNIHRVIYSYIIVCIHDYIPIEISSKDHF